MENAGAALVNIRWAKSTPEQRAEHASKMSAGRWEKTRLEREAKKAAKNAEKEHKKRLKDSQKTT